MAVHEGGGCCGLANLRTLCTPCHAKVTRTQAGRRAKARRAAPQEDEAGQAVGAAGTTGAEEAEEAGGGLQGASLLSSDSSESEAEAGAETGAGTEAEAGAELEGRGEGGVGRCDETERRRLYVDLT